MIRFAVMVRRLLWVMQRYFFCEKISCNNFAGMNFAIYLHSETVKQPVSNA